MTFLRIACACTIIFDRLDLPRDQPVDLAWQQHLLPALQAGLLHAEGARADYLNEGNAAVHGGRVWPDVTIEHEWPMSHVSRDWWLGAAPSRLMGDLHTLVRNGHNGRVEAVRHIIIRQSEIDRLWPASAKQESAYDIASKLAASKSILKKQDYKTLLKELLGSRYSDKVAENAWRNRMPDDRKPKGGRPPKPFH